MRLAAKFEYGCKAILELALRHGDQQPVQVHTIARNQRIPQKFLVQILMRLKASGLIVSIRGSSGGYLLSRHPSQLSVADVIGAIDDEMLRNAASHGGSISSKNVDVIGRLWKAVSDDVTDQLAKTDFEQLASQYQNGALTYSI